jgi:hypothetical protein
MAYQMESELETLPELEAEFEEEFEGEYEAEDELEDESVLEGEGWLSTLGNIAGSLLGESEDEYEGEYEAEYEDEAEISPIRKIYADAMMEHLGELAAEAETEDEAVEHFLPLVGMAASKLLPVIGKAVAPLAKRALPKIARALTRATPQLTRGVGTVAKALHRNPQTRHLLRAVPGIARRTVGNIAHRVARGGHVTPHTAVRTLARQTRHVLGTPQHRAQALRRHNHLERRFHTHTGHGVGRPHIRYGHPGAAIHRRPVHGVRTVAHGATHGVTHGVHGVAPGVHHVHYPGARVSVPGGSTGVRYGTTKTGARGACSCPKCGTPSYCRCCGQVIR